MRKNLKRVNDKNSGRIMTKKRRKSNANGKLEQNEKRVISLYFSFFFSEEKKMCVYVRASVCTVRAYNAIQLEHKQYECSAQHIVSLSHHMHCTHTQRRHTYV